MPGSATGGVLVTGALSKTLGALSILGLGLVTVTRLGALSKTLDAFTSLAAGTVAATGGITRPSGTLSLTGDSINNNIVDCVPFSESGTAVPANLGPGSSATTRTGGPIFADTGLPDGTGGYCTGGASYDIPTHDWSVDDDTTIRIVFYPNSWPTNYAAVLDSPTRNPMVAFDTNGAVLYTAYDSAGMGSPGFTLAAGQVWDLVITIAPAGTPTFAYAIKWYVNGSLVATTAGAEFATTADGQTLGRNSSGGGANADIIVLLYQKWQRVLSGAEISAIYADRWKGIA